MEKSNGRYFELKILISRFQELSRYSGHFLSSTSPGNSETGALIFLAILILIYIICVAGLVIRLVVEFVYIGPSAFSFSTKLLTLSQSAIFGTVLANLFLTFDVGLLVEGNVRVFQRYRAIRSGKESVKSLPESL